MAGDLRGAWVRPTQPGRRPGSSCRAAWTCYRCTDRSALGVCWGLPCSAELPTQRRPASGLTEDWFLPGPSPDPWPQVTRDPE